jgi:hypothetical protein
MITVADGKGSAETWPRAPGNILSAFRQPEVNQGL